MTTMHNFEASLEVRKLKDELSETELNTVSGGRAMLGDIVIVKYLDKASPKSRSGKFLSLMNRM